MFIGIIGRGFVGSALRSHCIKFCDNVSTYDIKDREISKEEAYTRLLIDSDIIFLCLPTPMKISGKCDTSILEDTLAELYNLAEDVDFERIDNTIAIKSTVSPGFTSEMQAKFGDKFKIVFYPEFLTERTANEDMANASRHIIGSNSESALSLLSVFIRRGWPYSEIIKTGSTEAELTKVMTNSFYSMKVSFANHIYDLCKSLGVDYQKYIKDAVSADPRLGDMHWQVPGPDGKRGYGGKCFVKDFSGLIYLMEELGLPTQMLKESIIYNNSTREVMDWSKIPGVISE